MKITSVSLCGAVAYSLFAVPSIWASSCKDGRDDLKTLPPAIGVEGKSNSVSFPLYCDTVDVPPGRKTVIQANSFLYFVKPSPVNLIHVQGTLLLRGVKDHYVIVAGGRNTKSQNPEPSKAMWSGILVEPGGKLEIEFAGLHGAPTPITAFSTNVKIVNSYFTGGSGIVKPDGNMFSLDPQFTAINFLDFSEEPKVEPTRIQSESSKPSHDKAVNATESDTLSHAEKDALLAKKSRGFWSRPSTWVVGGGILLASAVGGYLLSRPAHIDTGKMPYAPPQDSIPPTPN